jgi:hypothetical protein
MNDAHRPANQSNRSVGTRTIVHSEVQAGPQGDVRTWDRHSTRICAKLSAMGQRRGERGQELAELGITLVLFLLLVGGVMQFGHAFMVANMITHAARDGARLGASWSKRDANKNFTDVSAIVTAVKSEIATVTAQTFNVTVTQSPTANCLAEGGGTVPVVCANVQGCVPFIFDIPGLGTPCGGGNGFAVNRTVTFVDEWKN